MPIDAISGLCAQLTYDLLAIAKFFLTVKLNCCVVVATYSILVYVR